MIEESKQWWGKSMSHGDAWVWLVRAAAESERLNQTGEKIFWPFFEGKIIIFIINILREKIHTKIIIIIKKILIEKIPKAFLK